MFCCVEFCRVVLCRVLYSCFVVCRVVRCALFCVVLCECRVHVMLCCAVFVFCVVYGQSTKNQRQHQMNTTSTQHNTKHNGWVRNRVRVCIRISEGGSTQVLETS